MIKDHNLEKENTILALKIILENEDYRHEHLQKYSSEYKVSTEKLSELCSVCLEWEKIGLPNDCLSNPAFCVKNDSDYLIVKLYGDLKMHIELRL